MVYRAPLGLRAPRIDEQMKIDGSEDSRKDVDLDQPTPPFVLFASGRLLPCFKGLRGFDFFQNRVCGFQLSEIVNKWQPTSSSGCLLHLLPGTVLPWFSEKSKLLCAHLCLVQECSWTLQYMCHCCDPLLTL